MHFACVLHKREWLVSITTTMLMGVAISNLAGGKFGYGGILSPLTTSLFSFSPLFSIS